MGIAAGVGAHRPAPRRLRCLRERTRRPTFSPGDRPFRLLFAPAPAAAARRRDTRCEMADPSGLRQGCRGEAGDCPSPAAIRVPRPRVTASRNSHCAPIRLRISREPDIPFARASRLLSPAHELALAPRPRRPRRRRRGRHGHQAQGDEARCPHPHMMWMARFVLGVVAIFLVYLAFRQAG